MKRKNITSILIAVYILVFVSSCSGDKSGTKEAKAPLKDITTKAVEPLVDKETQLLLDDLEENGDYVNSRLFPSLIKGGSVSDGSEPNTYIIDIRSADEFTKGRIKGSVNVKFSDLLDFLINDIKPFEYNRIVMVSEDGQFAAYTPSLLRRMGYGNVYALRWGMSGWSKEFAETGWLAGCSSEYQSELETVINDKPGASGMPVLATGLSSGEEIGAKRFKDLFNEDPAYVMIDAALVFASPSDYYIINYDRRDKYESGHIQGAVRYKPGATLGIINEMATIPAGKTVVVYCGTGHNSGFVTAYLRLFGYDARTLRYGNNSFMYEKMKTEKALLSWLPFSQNDIGNFELIK
ncbi:MAG: rhodanese-like domain-containing protein [Bacteroidales bacterium]|nr:rhodanese-like domain-containing protein [Bacteroidales bacterium]